MPQPLDLETTRDYARANIVRAVNTTEVCVDGRNPRGNAPFIARGGGTLGLAIDFNTALREQGLHLQYPPQLIVARMINTSSQLGIEFRGHTDEHAEHAKPQLVDPATDPIGCKYISVAMEDPHHRKIVEVARTSPEAKIETLEKDHEETAVVLIEDEEFSVPHNAGGIMVFKRDLKRDIARMRTWFERLDLHGLHFEVLLEAADHNLAATLGAIPDAQGLPIFRAFRFNQVFEVEQIGLVGR